MATDPAGRRHLRADGCGAARAARRATLVARTCGDETAETRASPRMTVDLSSDVMIERPPSEVSAYASAPDNAPKWYVNIKSVEWQTPRSVAVGARIAFVAEFLGRR